MLYEKSVIFATHKNSDHFQAFGGIKLDSQETVRTSDARIKELEARLEELGHSGSEFDIPVTPDDATAEKTYHQPYDRLQAFYHRSDTLDLRAGLALAYTRKAKAHEALGQNTDAYNCHLAAKAVLKSVDLTLRHINREIKLGE